MPRAKEKSSDGLSIELLDDRKFYAPGSKVSGVVTLNTAQDFAIGSVSIEFYGRVKVYFVYSHGQGESQHRGRAPLFSEKRSLYEGYHTHKSGSFAWDFTFEIPKCPDLATVREAKHQWKDREHFLSTEDYIPSHAMPPTFGMRKWGFGYRWHSFIEYVLKVEVRQADGARIVLPPALTKAVLPIMVKEVAVPEPNTLPLPLSVQFTLPGQLTKETTLEKTKSREPQLQTQVVRQTIRSSRLDDYQARLGTRTMSFSNTIRDKAKSTFNSNSLSRFTFDLNVSIPTEVRLLEEGALPVMVAATPVVDGELTTIQAGSYPDITILNLSLELGASTYIRFKSIFPANTKTRYDVKLLDRHPVNHTISMNRLQSNVGSASTEAKPEAQITTQENGLNLSKLPGVGVSLVSAKMGRQTEKPLLPTFNTYIIAREYTLNWKMELEVAGERIKVSNENKIRVKILPPEPKHLETLMQDTDASRAEIQEEKDDDEASDDESVEVNDPNAKKGLLNKFKRRSKQQEAAEERAAAESSSRPDDGVLQYQPGEVLPTYEQNPTDFGYRHEIDDRPPRYEAP